MCGKRTCLISKFFDYKLENTNLIINIFIKEAFMKKEEMKTKVMAVAMSATMAASISAVPAMAVARRSRWQKMERIRRLHMSQEQRMMMKMNGMNMMSSSMALTVKDGKFSDIVVTPENGYESGNDSYFR